MNICSLNHSSKVCMKKGLARHTHTPPSSFSKPKIILTYIVQQRFGSWTHFPGCIALAYNSHIMIWTHLLHNENCRRSPLCSPLLYADRRWAQFFYNRPLKLGPALIPSHSVCLVIGSCCSEVKVMLSGNQRGAAGRATTIAYES